MWWGLVIGVCLIWIGAMIWAAWLDGAPPRYD